MQRTGEYSFPLRCHRHQATVNFNLPISVLVRGITGLPPPPTTKLAIFYRGGFQAEINWNFTGYGTAKKCELHEAQIKYRLKERGVLNQFDVLDFQRYAFLMSFSLWSYKLNYSCK